MTSSRKAKPTVVFFLIAFGVPWTAWTAMALMRLQRPSPWAVILLISGNFCSIAGFVAAYCAAGKKGIQDLLNRCLFFRVPIFWWGYALSLPLLVGSITAVIHSAARGEVVTFKPLEIVHQWWVLYNFIFAFFWGPLGEEAGWRGFLLPRLLEKYSPLTASLILGLIWSLWHVPLDYRSYFHTLAGTVGFTVHTLCMSILMTVLFINTRASVLLPMILHWSSNISYEFVGVIFPGSRFEMPDRVSEAVLVALTLIIILVFRRQLTDNSLTVANLRRSTHIVKLSGDYKSSQIVAGRAISSIVLFPSVVVPFRRLHLAENILDHGANPPVFSAIFHGTSLFIRWHATFSVWPYVLRASPSFLPFWSPQTYQSGALGKHSAGSPVRSEALPQGSNGLLSQCSSS